MGQALWASVLEALRRFEADEDVSIVWATERSSRLIGSHHAGSDCDVCAVFVMRRRKYFQLSAPRSTLRAAYAPADGSGAGGEVTICAYEARHACSLLAESNPTLVEALRSPLVYVARAGWIDGGAGARHGLWLDEARRLLDAHVNVGALAVAWARASKQNFITHVRRKGDAGVLRKKYVHVLRQLLAARYLIDRGGGDGGGGGGRQWPPARLLALAEATAPDDVVRELTEMLAPAARPALATVGPPIETLDSYIATSLQALDEAGVLKPGPRPPPTAALAAFDELCVRMVEEVSAQIEAR